MIDQPPLTVSEDFVYYAGAAPVMFFFVGSTPAGKDPATMPMNHSPLYSPDEGALDVGLRAMLQTTLDFWRPCIRCHAITRIVAHANSLANIGFLLTFCTWFVSSPFGDRT